MMNDSDGNGDYADQEEYHDKTSAVAIASHILTINYACLSLLHVASVAQAELDEEYIGDYSVNPLLQKLNRLDNLISGHISLFKSITGFYPAEFEALCAIVCPVLTQHARSTNEVRGQGGRPIKRTQQNRILSCVLYLRASNSLRAESASSNHNRTCVRDDALFVFSVINEQLVSEIRWPTAERRILDRNRICFSGMYWLR